MDTRTEVPDFPKTILIDTCSYCNLRCVMCPHKNMKRKKGKMEWSLYTKIIDEIATESPSSRVWLVFFGEALILKRRKPSIFDMIRYAKDKGLTDVVLNSNGCLLDRQSGEELLDSGLDGIFIGIDAFNEETYKKVRVGGNYKQTVQNILDLIDAKKTKKRSDFKIHVQFVEMDINQNQKEDFTRFWLSQGVTVKIRSQLTWAGLMGNKAEGYDNLERIPCYWLMNTMSITDQGQVVACADDPDGRFNAGNVREQTLEEIWHGRLRELQDLHKNSRWNELPEPCDNCPDWYASWQDHLINNPGPWGIATRIYRKILMHIFPSS